MKINKKEFKKAVQTAFANSPIEMVLSLLFFVLSCFVVVANLENVWENIQWYFFTCMAITYSLNIIFKKGAKRLFYYLSFLTPVLFLFNCHDEFSFTTLTITSLCALLLIYVARNLKDNGKFTSHAIAVTTNLFSAFALTVIAVLVAISIVQSINYIFGIEANTNDLLRMIANCGIFILLPLLFLIFEYKRDLEIRADRFFEILFNSILTPAIILYGLILYLYFAKIVILWTLPQGVISATAIGFIAGGIFVKACRILLDKKNVNWFFNYFSYLSLPALAMLWVSVLYRIAQYGFTGDRIYLLITVVTLTVWIFASLSSRFGKYTYLTIFTIVIYLVFTYVPGINAAAVDRKVAATPQKNEIEYLNIWVDKKESINIEGFRDLYYIPADNCVITQDSVILKDENGIEFFQKSSDEILDKLFKDVGVSDYQKLTKKAIDSLNNKMDVYRDSSVTIVYNGIHLIKKENKVYLNDLSIDYVITK